MKKIMIGYPPIDTSKGVPLLSQNRQFQYFNNPTYIYPVIPAYAATLLKEAGYEVEWADGIAEHKSMDEYINWMNDFDPDVYVCEVKTPVVKAVWEAIKTIKKERPQMKCILMGDHITALPEESLLNSPVDYCLTGGNFDTGLVNLMNHFYRDESMRPGVYWRSNGDIKSSGKFVQDESLRGLPFIDRDLTKWKLYAYHNGNFKYTPGTYTMAGRDCFVAGTLIETNEGQVPVEHIHTNHFVRTHTGKLCRVFEARKREVPQTVLIKPYCNVTVQCSPEHPFWTRKGWVEAKNLTDHDYIGYPIPHEKIDAESLYGLPMENEDLWFYGLYVAEGYAAKHGRQDITITLGIKEDDLRKRLVKYAEGRQYHVRLRLTKTSQQVIVNGPALLDGLKVLFRLGAHDKGVHPSVQALPVSKLRHFLDGYYAGDGHLDKRHASLRAVTVSKRLSLDLRNVLLRLGVICSVHKDGLYAGFIGSRQIRGKWAPYRLNVTRQFSAAWASIAPTLIPDGGIASVRESLPTGLNYEGKAVAFIADGYVWYRVRKVGEGSEATIYNFSVEDDQSYIADGLAVHNCWWRQDGGCTFCSWTTTFPKFQSSTPERLLDEVEHLSKNYGIREIFDDTGTFPIKGWLEKFCQGMIERGLNKKIKIGCNMRPGAIGQKEYDLMGKAGFRFILFGLESANQKSLDMLNKGQKPGDMWNAARMAKRAGLDPHVTCMVGYPWESKEEAKRTIDMTRELFQRGWIETLQATIVIPYPGTQLFRQCQENDWLLTSDWNNFDMRQPVMKTPVDGAEIMELTQGIYKSCITPRYVFRKLSTIRDVDDVKYLWRGVLALGGHTEDFAKEQLSPHVK
jgi:hypothetical protein